tara:strand:- start:1 stop:150 length:150 start_codon:yes stop_codon:yes gene_type:complete
MVSKIYTKIRIPKSLIQETLEVNVIYITVHSDFKQFYSPLGLQGFLFYF